MRLLLTLLFSLVVFSSPLLGQIPVRFSLKLDLRKGINFGNMLEAPFEGAWGLHVEEAYFDKVVEGGFTHIRLPVSWTHYADTESPYTIDESIFERVDWILEQAKQRRLKIVLNNHHYEELNADPVGEQERALAIWQQIATRYQNERRYLAFEILNEPHGVFSEQPELWNQHFAAALSVIRVNNPYRQVIVGPVGYNNIHALKHLSLPDDINLIVTFHYYSPFEFTHQGASWVQPPPPLGELWIPERYTFATRWQNWSWNTEIERTLDGVSVDYTAGWAGLRFHAVDEVSGATELRFNFDKAATIRVNVQNDETSQVTTIQTAAGMQDYVVVLDNLGANGLVTDVTFQLMSPNPLSGITMSEVQLIDASGQATDLIATQAENVAADFLIARRFRETTGIPVYLGEFGAYELGDYTSRVQYTETVREAARFNRLGWAYWEFGAGFGVYNPEDDTWNLELLQALIPY